MANRKFISIDYDTPEQAAAMAAQINANDARESVRAYSNGRTLEVAPCNDSVADLINLFSMISKGINSVVKRLLGTNKASPKTTAAA